MQNKIKVQVKGKELKLFIKKNVNVAGKLLLGEVYLSAL